MSCDRTPKNVLVIEPESLTRLGIATVVSLHPLLRVCGEAANARAARQLSVERSPDLIVLEIVLPNGDGLELLVEGGEGRLMLLLRMAAASREFAARLLAGPGDLLGIADAAAEIERFDRLTQADVDMARDWLRLDPAYRRALAALGQDNGQRAL